MDDSNTEIMGKKVFFLHPSAFIQNTIIEDLIGQEYEVYLVKDEVKIERALRKFPGSIVFACIDETRSPEQWESWTRQLLGNKAIRDIKLGVISNTNNDETRELYLNTLKVPCGFIPVRADKDKAIKLLLHTLSLAEAKGRRKYLRTTTLGETKTTINLSVNDTYVTGDILDISVVGLSCTFPNDIKLEKNALFPNIQIKLQSSLLKVEGIVYGSREEKGTTVYVLLFTSKIDFAVRARIRTYIQKRLQSLMEEEMQ